RVSEIGKRRVVTELGCRASSNPLPGERAVLFGVRYSINGRRVVTRGGPEGLSYLQGARVNERTRVPEPPFTEGREFEGQGVGVRVGGRSSNLLAPVHDHAGRVLAPIIPHHIESAVLEFSVARWRLRAQECVIGAESFESQQP